MPRIEKVVINVGIGKFIKDAVLVMDIFNSLKNITGQKPVMTKAKQSIVGFKTRQGLEIIRWISSCLTWPTRVLIAKRRD